MHTRAHVHAHIHIADVLLKPKPVYVLKSSEMCIIPSDSTMYYILNFNIRIFILHRFRL